MPKIGDIVYVTTLEAKLRTRTDRHGSDWEVFSDIKPMSCLDNENGVLIRAVLDGTLRYVKVSDIRKVSEIC